MFCCLFAGSQSFNPAAVKSSTPFSSSPFQFTKTSPTKGSSTNSSFSDNISSSSSGEVTVKSGGGGKPDGSKVV